MPQGGKRGRKVPQSGKKQAFKNLHRRTEKTARHTNRPNTKNPPTAEQKRRPKDRQSPKILKNKKQSLKTDKKKPKNH